MNQFQRSIQSWLGKRSGPKQPRPRRGYVPGGDLCEQRRLLSGVAAGMAVVGSVASMAQPPSGPTATLAVPTGPTQPIGSLGMGSDSTSNELVIESCTITEAFRPLAAQDDPPPPPVGPLLGTVSWG